MSPIVIFLLGAYIGACAGVCAMLLWWYWSDCRKQSDGSNRETWQ